MSKSVRASEIASLKAVLEQCLHEDSSNLESILNKVDQLAWAAGRGLHAHLLQLLFNVNLEEDEARRQWEAILKHRSALEATLRRPVPLRVAAMDTLIEANRRMARPRLLEMLSQSRPLPGDLMDPISGLRTRDYIDDQMPREIGRAQRYNLNLSIVHMEIDDFPAVVEELGHAIGSLLQREVAGVISSRIRNIDYAARSGSGRFVLLLTETDRMGAYHVADRIRSSVEEFYLERRVNGRPFGLTVSAGVASYPEDADGPEALEGRAIEAYYTARVRGKGRVAIHHHERREYLRLSMQNQDLQVTLIPEGSERSAAGAMKNISSGGVLFDSDTPIELGRIVHILCRNRKESDQVLIPGRVVRIEKFDNEEGARYEVGVLFDLNVEEQLEGVIEFLERFTVRPEQPEDQPRPA
jgi:diguanylate cyclase (GGDEF)-like protein